MVLRRNVIFSGLVSRQLFFADLVVTGKFIARRIGRFDFTQLNSASSDIHSYNARCT
jgi:hypothetical protein